MRRLLLIALVLGVAGGCAASLAIPDTRLPDPSIGAPYHAPEYELRVRVVPGTVRTEVRRDDPDGGPAWVVRTFAGQAVRQSGPLGSRSWCVQLVRELHGRAGWVDGANVFHAVGFGLGGAPTSCSPSIPGVREPVVQATTLLQGIETPAATARLTVAWGWGGPSLRAVRLRLGDGHSEPSISRRGAFLAFSKPLLLRGSVSATLTYAGVSRTIVPGESGALGPPGLPGERPGKGPAVLEARAPDPNGGLPYAFGSIRGTRGGACPAQAARAVEGRVGEVDYSLGTFEPSRFSSSDCHGRHDERIARHPLLVTYMFDGGTMPERNPSAGRVARRTLRGTTIVSGFARADVREVTIQTPRGIRTIAPTGPHHGLIVVYDGTFPTGQIVLTARFADGTSRVVERFDTAGI